MQLFKIQEILSQSSEVSEARYFRSENEEYQSILEEVESEMNFLYLLQSLVS
jgi:hypothetical protein